MRRIMVSLLCCWALLVQTTAFAWMPPATPAAQSSSMHCHGHAAKAAQHHHDCCGDRCACADLCTAPIAIPAQVEALQTFVAAHFEALHDFRAVIPAAPPELLRPPISDPS